jgi:hypothetical protein
MAINVFREIVAFGQRIQAPWAFGLIVMVTAFGVWILYHDSIQIPKAAYQFAAVLVGGYVSTALLAAGVGAMRTMFLLAFCALLLILCILHFTPSETFKDSAVEGLLTLTAGGLVVLIKATLERHKEPV